MSLALLRGHKPPSEEQLVESVEGIMGTHGLKTAAFFGHSFGSISVAWMARRKPHVSFFFEGKTAIKRRNLNLPTAETGPCAVN